MKLKLFAICCLFAVFFSCKKENNFGAVSSGKWVLNRLVLYASFMQQAGIFEYPDTLTLNNGNYFFSYSGNGGNYTVIDEAKLSKIEFNSFGIPVMTWQIVRYDANSFQAIYTENNSSTSGAQLIYNYYYERIP
jgi:hypothetical protein